MEITGLDKIKKEEEREILGLDKIKKQEDISPFSTFAIQLIDLITLAKDCDTKLEEFGADRHEYVLNPVIPISQVKEFERRHNISLPRGYVDFLTKVGNGGAGPDFGLYSLEEAEYRNYYAHTEHHHTTLDNVNGEKDFYTLPYCIDFVDPLVTSGLTKEIWNDWVKNLKNLAGHHESYDKIRPQAYNGLLEIADSGCSYSMMLVCSGDLCGEIIAFDHDFQMPNILNLTFEKWMMNHFKKVIDIYGEKRKADKKYRSDSIL